MSGSSARHAQLLLATLAALGQLLVLADGHGRRAPTQLLLSEATKPNDGGPPESAPIPERIDS